jgi:GDPmannose 4,6-dehydratase
VKVVNEKGFNKANGSVLVEIDPKYFRPTEVELLIGNPTKANKELGWKHTTSFSDLVKEMVNSDIELFKRDKYLLDGGHNVMNYYE